MSVGNELSTPVGSNWLHVVAMTLNTKQQQQQQKTKQKDSAAMEVLGWERCHSLHIKVKCSALKNIRLPKTSFKTYRFVV